MTTAESRRKFRFPDPPEREPDDLTSFDHLALNGNAHHLIQHFGNPETTLIAGEHYLARIHTRDLTGVRYPDLLIAFGVHPAAYRRSNAYVLSEQGKPPDFVLEIASRRTAREDVGDKRNDYAALHIPEYWRFAETTSFRVPLLAGDRLTEDGHYRPIPIEEGDGGVLQGYSQVLNLLLRWENGQLAWHDPETGRHIVTFEDQREALSREREALSREREALSREREAFSREREARLLAEARVRELEARLEGRNNQ